tara:strand:+ start:238 stop:489 length:252 start_codon:yes stop_codon:yes gene_type:complete
MLQNRKPLGYSQKKNLHDGDLVYWKVWKVEDKKLETVVNYGTILDIIVEKRGQREVYVANILCSNTGDTIQVNLLRLQKEETI